MGRIAIEWPRKGNADNADDEIVIVQDSACQMSVAGRKRNDVRGDDVALVQTREVKRMNKVRIRGT
jgi:hypothetical protein